MHIYTQNTQNTMGVEIAGVNIQKLWQIRGVESSFLESQLFVFSFHLISVKEIVITRVAAYFDYSANPFGGQNNIGNNYICTEFALKKT